MLLAKARCSIEMAKNSETHVNPAPLAREAEFSKRCGLARFIAGTLAEASKFVLEIDTQ
jgi:hypothetical protein